MADESNTTKRKRTPLPTPLPESSGRALWIGYESSRWFPFDPFIYLERAALLGAPVVLGESGIYYAEPDQPSDEHEFLRGWHNGCPGASKMVGRVLRENADIRAAHMALANVPRS